MTRRFRITPRTLADWVRLGIPNRSFDAAVEALAGSSSTTRRWRARGEIPVERLTELVRKRPRSKSRPKPVPTRVELTSRERKQIAEQRRLFAAEVQRIEAAKKNDRRSKAAKKGWATRNEKKKAKALRAIERAKQKGAVEKFRARPRKIDLKKLAKQVNTRRLKLRQLRVEGGRVLGTDPTGRNWVAYRVRPQTEPGEPLAVAPILWTRTTTAEGFAKSKDSFRLGSAGELTSTALSQTPPGDETYEEQDRDDYDLDFDNWEEAS